MKIDYWKSGIWRIDLALFRSYSFGRAYGISARERPRINSGEGISFTYGETPLAAMEQILSYVDAKKEDRFVELGCGVGRFSMVAARCVGMKVIGVERISSFVSNAKKIASRLELENITFIEDDIFDYSWTEGSVFYITPTTFSEERVRLLATKYREIPYGARLVTLTHPCKEPGFHLLKMDVLDFSWGPATVFVYQRQMP